MKKIYQGILPSFKIITIFLLAFPAVSNAQEFMRANLYISDASGVTLLDGNLTNYNGIYSNEVDINDGWKMINPGANFGILRQGYNLVVERRSIIQTSDTTYFRIWNTSPANYQIKFILSNLNHPGMQAVLRDKFLGTETSLNLNDTTYFNFRISGDAGSADEMRFQLVYRTPPVDVNFNELVVRRQDKNVLVNWTVSNDVAMHSYTVEHATDAQNFHAISQVISVNSTSDKTYSYIDMGASCGDNFYRIKALGKNGKVQYSLVAKAAALPSSSEINIYPNPVVNKTVQLQFGNLPAGKYSVTLLYLSGINRPLSSINLVSGQSNYSVNLPKNLTPGAYQLVLLGPGNIKIARIIEVL